MDFMKPAKFFFALSAALTLISIVIFLYPGPQYSIEFTGGTRMEVTLPLGTETAELNRAVQLAIPGKGEEGAEVHYTINRTQDGNGIVRFPSLSDQQHQQILASLSSSIPGLKEVQYTTIGPTVGRTLQIRAIYALIVASIGIILYLAFSFRKIPRRYSPWKFGMVAVLTLLHDVMMTVGIFVVLSHYTTFEVDTLFVTALLTILGYSVNDTIVIFDRIRDNLFLDERKEEFEKIANRSINQTVKRSLYTGISTLIMLSALFLLGSSSIQWFVLTLIIGIVLGTYSSIFVATPLLVYWNKRKK